MNVTLAEIVLLVAGALMGIGVTFFIIGWLVVLLVDDPNE
jgi:hypothetical protein